MKKLILITLALALTAVSPGAEALAKSRPAKAETTQTTTDTKEEEGIVAYSDTTGTQAREDSVTYYNGQGTGIHLDLDDDDAPFWKRMAADILAGTAGFWATTFAMLVVTLVFLFLCAPFIVLGLFIWYMVRRNRQRMDFARHAMESGQPITREMLSMELRTDSYMWSKGVRNVFLGLGLIVFDIFIGTDILMGVGALLICMGAGQCVIAKTSGKSERQERPYTPPKDNDEEENDTMPRDNGWTSTLHQIANNAKGQRGVMTAFTGLGLVVFGLFLDSEGMAAIGGLVFCIGAGMCVIAKMSDNNTRKE